MKLGKKRKKEKERSASRERDDEDDDRSKSRMGGADWMVQGRDDLNRARRRADQDAKRSRRPPEIWIPDGDSRILRFRSSEPLAGVWQYSIRVNGKWRTVTRPAPGERDLMAKAGLEPRFREFYEVLDVKGYVDKKGKKQRNIPRFFPVAGRLAKQVEKMREKYGGLTKRNFEICRTGKSKDTTYTIIPEDKEPMTDKQKDQPRLTLKEFMEYYAPPSIDEQRVLLAGVGTDDDDEEEERPRKKKKGRRDAFDDDDDDEDDD